MLIYFSKLSEVKTFLVDMLLALAREVEPRVASHLGKALNNWALEFS
ncbi:hypothetical protein NIES37_44790 [Tolypothrix tenuis PCC 7101]|uniref:Uncharacterized protein n=1 Tax=Tolypothrix tenuis PCC 7101 TaxID=231146 RepID=A0A1Z4N463_9CYAN|nr:hypothetical protein NIES37_44790 [Tolypothrix tenuis PCC 7101]BAZ75591.1 hypothetical protein NIES50_41790 [Aulosira laxa NIES-50]